MTRREHRRRSRRGLTMIIAITLLALVAVALASVAQLLRDDAARSFDERVNAQLRALVLAGMVQARSQLQQGGAVPTATTLTLPGEAGDAAVRLEGRQDGDAWRVHIVASIDGRQMRSDCTFARHGNAWAIRETTIEPGRRQR